jgi:hypothetical protein
VSKKATLCVFVGSLLVIFAISAGAQAPAPPAPAKPLFDGGSAVEGLPVDIFDRIIYLPVKVNGTVPLTLALDTGAGNISALDKTVAESMGLDLTMVYRGPGGAGADTIEVFSADSLTIAAPGLSFAARTIFTLPLRRMESHWGKRKDGLFGGDLLSTLVTRIDYENEKVDFHDAASYEYTGPGETIPLEIFGNSIFIRAEVLLYGKEEAVPALLMVDTGMRITVFNGPFAKTNGLPAQSPTTTTGVTGFGIGGVSKGTVGRVRGIRFGSVLIEAPVVNFSIDEGGALADTSFSGILGADILSRFHTVYDYSRSRMVLEKNRFFSDPYNFDMSGIRFVMEGEKFDVLKVFSLFDPSPAAQAGIREGDIVTKIDGRDASSFNRETLREYLEREGNEVRFEIKRGEETKKIAVRLRKMV